MKSIYEIEFQNVHFSWENPLKSIRIIIYHKEGHQQQKSLNWGKLAIKDKADGNCLL